MIPQHTSWLWPNQMTRQAKNTQHTQRFLGSCDVGGAKTHNATVCSQWGGMLCRLTPCEASIYTKCGAAGDPLNMPPLHMKWNDWLAIVNFHKIWIWRLEEQTGKSDFLEELYFDIRHQNFPKLSREHPGVAFYQPDMEWQTDNQEFSQNIHLKYREKQFYPVSVGLSDYRNALCTQSKWKSSVCWLHRFRRTVGWLDRSDQTSCSVYAYFIFFNDTNKAAKELWDIWNMALLRKGHGLHTVCTAMHDCVLTVCMWLCLNIGFDGV